MKRFSEQFHKQASGIKLKASERRELHDRLLSYMEYHPLPAEMKKQTAKNTKEVEGLASEPFIAFHVNMSYLRAAFSTMAVLTIIAVPFVAERSLPGDVLYPVKVEFNEEVRSTLSLSSYAKVEWETERLERRVAEARLLANEGKLTEEVEAQVAEAVKQHSNNAQKEIAVLRESDEDEAAIAEITFASALAVQSEVLEGHMAGDEEGQEEGRSVVALADAVAEAHQVAEASQVGANPSYEKLLARVELESTRASELFTSISEYASEEEVNNIERRLADIRRKVSSAIALHDNVPVEEVVGEDVLPEDVEDLIPEEVITESLDGERATGTEPELIEETVETAEPEESAEANEEEPVEITEEGSEIDNEKEAKEALRSALSDIRKLISFMTDIDVRENVNIDELVPVTLTDDERISKINSDLEELKARQVKLEQRIVPETIYEKYIIGADKLEGLIISAEEAREEGQYASAQANLDEAALVIDDLVLMTKEPKKEPVEAEEDTVEDESATGTPDNTEEVVLEGEEAIGE